MQRVFVLDNEKSPLMPCLPARARKLLASGKAKVYRVVPFTIMLQDRSGGNLQDVEVKLDPGSRTSGIAVVADFKQGKTVVWGAELTHRSVEIVEKLRTRASLRRSRRNRNTRYRKPRFSNRATPKGWLAPSLRSRVDNIVFLVKKLTNFLPVTSLGLEDVRFDTQLLQNPNIENAQYQQGVLAGFELREYMLLRYNHTCFYCLGQSKDSILEIDHIVPRSKGGGNSVANLVLSCHSCNQAKGSTMPKDWLASLSSSTSVLKLTQAKQIKKLLAGVKPVLRDAGMMNATRNTIKNALLNFNLPLITGSGGLTKFNRSSLHYLKKHWIDASCVGPKGHQVLLHFNMKILVIKAQGRGSRQMCKTDKFGFPRTRAKKVKRVEGFQTGDLVKLVQPSGKYKGAHVGKVAIRETKKFDMLTSLAPQKVRITAPHTRFTLLQKSDGYAYTFA